MSPASTTVSGAGVRFWDTAVLRSPISFKAPRRRKTQSCKAGSEGASVWTQEWEKITEVESWFLFKWLLLGKHLYDLSDTWLSDPGGDNKRKIMAPWSYIMHYGTNVKTVVLQSSITPSMNVETWLMLGIFCLPLFSAGSCLRTWGTVLPTALKGTFPLTRLSREYPRLWQYLDGYIPTQCLTRVHLQWVHSGDNFSGEISSVLICCLLCVYCDERLFLGTRVSWVFLWLPGVR